MKMKYISVPQGQGAIFTENETLTAQIQGAITAAFTFCNVVILIEKSLPRKIGLIHVDFPVVQSMFLIEQLQYFNEYDIYIVHTQEGLQIKEKILHQLKGAAVPQAQINVLEVSQSVHMVSVDFAAETKEDSFSKNTSPLSPHIKLYKKYEEIPDIIKWQDEVNFTICYKLHHTLKTIHQNKEMKFKLNFLIYKNKEWMPQKNLASFYDSLKVEIYALGFQPKLTYMQVQDLCSIIYQTLLTLGEAEALKLVDDLVHSFYIYIHNGKINTITENFLNEFREIIKNEKNKKFLECFNIIDQRVKKFGFYKFFNFMSEQLKSNEFQALSSHSQNGLMCVFNFLLKCTDLDFYGEYRSQNELFMKYQNFLHRAIGLKPVTSQDTSLSLLTETLDLAKTLDLSPFELAENYYYLALAYFNLTNYSQTLKQLKLAEEFLKEHVNLQASPETEFELKLNRLMQATARLSKISSETSNDPILRQSFK